MKRPCLILVTLIMVGCSATMRVKVDIANPTIVHDLHAQAKAHLICSEIVRGEERLVIERVAASMAATVNECRRLISAKLSDVGTSSKQGHSLSQSLDTLKDLVEEEVEPVMTSIQTRRNSLVEQLTSAPKQGASVCAAAAANSAELIAFDRARREKVEALSKFNTQISDFCVATAETPPARDATTSSTTTVPPVAGQPTVSAVTGEMKDKVVATVAQARAAIMQAETFIGEGSLTKSDYAFAVSSLDPKDWNLFNVVNGDARGGNLDLAIKMNEPGDFTIKGMRFDATKVAEMVSKSFVQLLLISAGSVGQAVNITKSPGYSKGAAAAHTELSTHQVDQTVRAAKLKKFRSAALDMALQISNEVSQLNGSDIQRKQAITAIKSTIAHHSPRLSLDDLP